MKTKIILLILISVLVIRVQINACFGQSTILGNSLSGTAPDPNEYIGSSNGYNLEFKGNGTLYMKLLQSNGYVGIGSSYSPTYLLDVNGDINGGGASTSTSNSFRLGTDRVLWHNGTNSNIFVGVLAGTLSTSGSGCTFVGHRAGATTTGSASNTFIGSDAGWATTTGAENAFVGSLSGQQNDDGNDNAYLGVASGQDNNSGHRNTLIGYYAGNNNKVDDNSFVGNNSGYSNTYGKENSSVGSNAGYFNTIGDSNSCFGYYSGKDMVVGNANVFVGYGTSVPNGATLRNAVAIGAMSQVTGSNEMILGDNDIHVGIGLSGNATGPGNKLEIDEGNIDQSGLRFRQLTSSSSAVSNIARGVLSVDGDGDVLLVNENFAGANNGTSLDAATSTTVQLGQDAVGGSGAALLNDRDIPMSDFNLYFTEPASPDVTMNNIAMGVVYPLASTLPTRLTVEKTSLNIELVSPSAVAGEFTAYCGTTDNLIGVCYGVWGKAIQIAGNTDYEQIGGRFEGKGTTTKGTYGVWGRASGNRSIWGGFFDSAGNPNTIVGIGVEGRAAKAAFNIGVYGFTQAPVPPLLNYAVYGDLGIVGPLPPPCIVLPCPPVTFPDAAGYFNGDMVSTTSFFSLSDGSFKTNVDDIQNALGIINQLNPKSYTFSHELHPSMQMPTGSHYGLISQEVQNILPGVVKDCIHPARYDSVGNEIYAAVNFKALNYTELIPFLIAGMKEQQQIIEAMQAQISNLTGGGNRNANPGRNGDEGNSNSIDIELKNIREIVLNQNFPNPFAEYTTITFVISDDVKKAQIFFYDDKGTILKSVDINEKGAGQINVYAPDLSSGIYKYTLITDGKPIETKQMVKSN